MDGVLPTDMESFFNDFNNSLSNNSLHRLETVGKLNAVLSAISRFVKAALPC